MNRWIFCLMFGLLAVGCTEDAAPTQESFSKDEAERNEGLTRDGQDICELMGWYADGVCDDFCDGIDQDCDALNNGINDDCDAVKDGIDDDCDAVVDPIAVDTACGGSTGAKCAEGFFCDFAISTQCGANGAAGQCKALTEDCTNDYEPVCGCDGQTYNTACDAATLGVSVSTNAACEVACTTAEECGAGYCVDGVCAEEPPTTCNDTSACALGYFCYLGSTDACNISGDGTCELTMQACQKNYAPVCGCDGVTYGNACLAGAAGANIEANGECPRACVDAEGCLAGEVCKDSVCSPGPVGCGARLGDTCQDDEYCHFELLAVCGHADQTGVCTERPQACPENIDPVCGCDQMTYNNACDANAAGTGVYHVGACQTTCTSQRDCDDGEVCKNNVCSPGPTVCGGRSGGVCDAATEWCNYGGPANLCGQFDAEGTCAVRPQICTAQYDPVCGCNGMTYGNSCEAHAAGVDVLSVGACPITR